MRFNHKYGAGRVTDYSFGNASHQNTFQAGSAMASHNDKVCFYFFCRLYDLLVRWPIADDCFGINLKLFSSGFAGPYNILSNP